MGLTQKNAMQCTASTYINFIYRLTAKNYKSTTKAFGLSGMIIVLGVRGLKFDSQNAPNNIISKWIMEDNMI